MRNEEDDDRPEGGSEPDAALLGVRTADQMRKLADLLAEMPDSMPPEVAAEIRRVAEEFRQSAERVERATAEYDAKRDGAE